MTDGFYTPSEIQKQQARAAIDDVSVNIGRFVLEWSKIEGHLRTLELMHKIAPYGKGSFRPLASLDGTDLHKTRRFTERVKLVIPQSPLCDWLVEASKIRNLILHGMLVFVRRPGKESGRPVVNHIDFTSTMAAQKGWPRVTHAKIPMYKNSVSPEQYFRADGLGKLVDETKDVRENLYKIIEATHKHGRVRISPMPGSSALDVLFFGS